MGTALDVEIITYEDFSANNAAAVNKLKEALLKNGIVGIKEVPGFRELVAEFIQTARDFQALSEATKNQYAPNRDIGEFLGYEEGMEKFQRPDGSWAIDRNKVSFYTRLDQDIDNKWPAEVPLKSAFQNLGVLITDVAKTVMEKVALTGGDTGISPDDLGAIGRMLYYRNQKAIDPNPYWCGAHFDHGTLTALLPAFYFQENVPVSEPPEAGLFVRTDAAEFRKVVVHDSDVLLFQVGEFGQLISNDKLKATEHRVHRAIGPIERYTLAIFFTPQSTTAIRSVSILTQDTRYGDTDECIYGDWHVRSIDRYRAR